MIVELAAEDLAPVAAQEAADLAVEALEAVAVGQAVDLVAVSWHDQIFSDEVSSDDVHALLLLYSFGSFFPTHGHKLVLTHFLSIPLLLLLTQTGSGGGSNKSGRRRALADSRGKLAVNNNNKPNNAKQARNGGRAARRNDWEDNEFF